MATTDTQGQTYAIAADGICFFRNGVGVRQLTAITRVGQMIFENI